MDNLDDWAAYVSAVVGRYKGTPLTGKSGTRGTAASTMATTPRRLRRLALVTTSRPSRKPTAARVGLSGPRSFDAPYLNQAIRAIAKAGKPGSFDYLCIHPYEIADGLAEVDGEVPFPVDEPPHAQHAESSAPRIGPTRELAIQVSKELQWLYANAGARVVTCVGGMDPMKERRALSGGAHIVVGTPGRLRDHLERGALDLSSLRVAVLDEADEMLDMGFRDELEEILDATPRTRRTLLFSATMPRPIVALAKRYQKDALRIETLGDKEGHQDIAYQAVAVSPTDIEHAVVNLLRFHEAETAILFCATRDAVRRLYASLTERGFHAVALSGEHSQNERNQALQALRDQRARVCVATDVAARGIDLPSVSLVIHVELPRDAEALQHRSGRTGRAGRKGTAILIVPFQRRKRVEAMLRGARIDAEWISVPSASAIRAKDRERLLATFPLRSSSTMRTASLPRS